MILHLLQQFLPFLPLVFGLYISYGILKITDLSTDASFLIGAAIFGLALRAGFPPGVCFSLVIGAGLAFGCLVAILHMRLHPLLCGILLVFIVSTLVLKIMGKPNLSLLNYPSCLSLSSLILSACFLFGFVGYLLHSKVGILLHALGNNPSLFALSGKNTTLYRMIGLSLHSALSTFSGAATAALYGYVDISMAIGIVLIALGTLILGQKIFSLLFSTSSHFLMLLCLTLSTVGYFFFVIFLLRLGIDPIYLRLVIGISLMSLFILSHSSLKKGATP